MTPHALNIVFQSPCGDYTLIRMTQKVPSLLLANKVSVPLRGLYPYKGAPYHWLNHAGSKPGFGGTTLRSLNFCDNFFHNVQETACLLMRGGFSVFWLLYAYSIPRKDGLIKAFIGIFSEKNQAIFTISEFVKNPTCISSSPSYFFWQVERTRLQYTMSCKKHSVLWIL